MLHIVIFDEIDAICKTRGSVRDGTGVSDSVVNQLLSKIDGVDSLNNVLIIGMTNRKVRIASAVSKKAIVRLGPALSTSCACSLFPEKRRSGYFLCNSALQSAIKTRLSSVTHPLLSCCPPARPRCSLHARPVRICWSVHVCFFVGIARQDMIDDALLRPGRLEVHVEIGLPDEAGRLQILQIHTRGMVRG